MIRALIAIVLFIGFADYSFARCGAGKVISGNRVARVRSVFRPIVRILPRNR